MAIYAFVVFLGAFLSFQVELVLGKYILPWFGGTPAVFNVGGVKTDGIDAALTLRFGQVFSLYNAVSYNRSIYDSDYSTITGAATGTRIGGIATVGGVVPTGGKLIQSARSG